MLLVLITFSFFLRNTSASLAYPLSLLFNRCLSEGTFPDSWKSANIIPIPKSGDRSNVSAYRPFSHLSSVSILCEKIVKDRLYNFVKPYLNDFQHGFLPEIGRAHV